jgi:hypothetical protein
VERSEIAAQDGANPARPVGAEFDDAAGDDGVLREKEFVIAVDGVHQLSANWLSVAHGKVLIDA